MDNEISEDDKKFLAERLGYVWQPGLVSFDGEPHTFNGTTSVGPNWSVDTRHKQFKDVFNSMDITKRTSIYKKLGCYYNDFNRSISEDIVADRILNNLPKVCQAAIDVIKESNA